jgi:DNA-binding transcriptional ArsR family regulator
MLDGDLLTAKKRFFASLADENRLVILQALCEKNLTVNELCQITNKSQSLISHHLTCLRTCGLVTTEKRGKYTLYSIKNPSVIQILKIADEHVQKTLQNILKCEIVR